MPKKAKRRNKAIENRRAQFQYQATDSLEVGMVLTGEEIKSIRAGHMQLTGSYGRFLQGPNGPELWLIGATIAKAQGDKQRSIKLLAHKAEISRLVGLVGQKGFTLVPNRVYMKNNRAKLQLSIAQGRKDYEKRAVIRDREVKREIDREVRQK